MTPIGRAYLDELKAILLQDQHPDGRPLGRRLARRLADTFHHGGATPVATVHEAKHVRPRPPAVEGS